jgi:two-component system NtrC family sensor kinase
LLSSSDQREARSDVDMDEPQIEALGRRNAEMTALFRGSLVVSASSSQDEIQQNILDLVEELYDLSLSFIMLYNNDQDVLEVTAYEGDKGEFLSDRALQRSEGIVDWVFSRKESLITNTIQSDERVSFRDELLEIGIESILCVPLITKGNAIGVMGLCLPYREDTTKLEDTGRLLRTFAGQAAIAIDNARLYEELEHANKQIIEWNESLQQRVDETTEKLVTSRERLWHAERLSTVGKLVAGFLHEINNPLYAISNYAQRLMELESGSTKLKYLESIAGGVNAIKGITENLSELTRLSSLSISDNDINELLEDTIVLIEFDAQEQQIIVEKNFDDDLPPVEVDGTKLRQVFLNLLINALDAMPEGGTIAVGTRAFPDYISIKFSDTGMGIDQADVPRVFEPFFSTKGDDGIGLGLFVSNSIVRAHNGAITFESENNAGTSFEIRLPIKS